jgi:DNA-binding FadR family transcriptional regulator
MSAETGPARSLAAVFTPVRTVGLVEEICDRIEAAVESGTLTNGQRLPNEAEFAVTLGVSAMTAREALSRLRAQGIVTTRRGRNGGSFIADDADSMLTGSTRQSTTRVELEDFRRHVQSIAGACAETAAIRSDANDTSQLRAYLQAPDDPRQWRLAESEFLLEVAAVARSARLTRELLRLQTDSAWLVAAPPTDREYRKRMLDLRESIIAAIESRDGAAARERIRELVAAPIDEQLALDRPVPSAGAEGADVPVSGIAGFFASIEQRLGEWAVALGRQLTPHGPNLGGVVIDRLVKPEVETLLADSELGLTGAGFVANVGVVGPDRTHFAWWQGTELDRADVMANFSSHSQARYLRAEWFRAPLSTGTLEITGPYVDLLCTDEYIITFTAPVVWPHTPGIVGVVGMDVTLPSLERRILHSLRQIGDAVLVNGEGRAVVSSAPDVASGDLLPDLHLNRRWAAGSRFAIVAH